MVSEWFPIILLGKSLTFRTEGKIAFDISTIDLMQDLYDLLSDLETKWGFLRMFGKSKRKEMLQNDSQPSSDHGKRENLSSCGSPKEDETMFTSSLSTWESLNQMESHIAPLSLYVDHKEEENANMDRPLRDVENMTQSYDNNSDFCNSSHISWPNHEIATISCENDGCVESPNADTQVSGVIDAIGVVYSSHNMFEFVHQTMENKSENLPNGDGSEDCLTDVHTYIWIGDVSIDIGISTASNMSFEPSQEVHNNDTFVEDVCEVDNTHDDAYTQ